MRGVHCRNGSNTRCMDGGLTVVVMSTPVATDGAVSVDSAAFGFCGFWLMRDRAATRLKRAVWGTVVPSKGRMTDSVDPIVHAVIMVA